MVYLEFQLHSIPTLQIVSANLANFTFNYSVCAREKGRLNLPSTQILKEYFEIFIMHFTSNVFLKKLNGTRAV